MWPPRRSPEEIRAHPLRVDHERLDPGLGGSALAYQIITDSTTWSAFWHRSVATPVPELRFEDEFVLRVEWGTQPTGG